MVPYTAVRLAGTAVGVTLCQPPGARTWTEGEARQAPLSEWEIDLGVLHSERGIYNKRSHIAPLDPPWSRLAPSWGCADAGARPGGLAELGLRPRREAPPAASLRSGGPPSVDSPSVSLRPRSFLLLAVRDTLRGAGTCCFPLTFGADRFGLCRR